MDTTFSDVSMRLWDNWTKLYTNMLENSLKGWEEIVRLNTTFAGQYENLWLYNRKLLDEFYDRSMRAENTYQEIWQKNMQNIMGNMNRYNFFGFLPFSIETKPVAEKPAVKEPTPNKVVAAAKAP